MKRGATKGMTKGMKKGMKKAMKQAMKKGMAKGKNTGMKNEPGDIAMKKGNAGRDAKGKFQWMPEEKVKAWLGKKYLRVAKLDGWFETRGTEVGQKTIMEYKVYNSGYIRPPPESTTLEDTDEFLDWLMKLQPKATGDETAALGQ